MNVRAVVTKRPMNEAYLFNMKIYILFLYISLITNQSNEKFIRNYYDSGQVESFGWINNNNKIDYWEFFHKNGSIKAKGSYNNNLKDGYWFFYNTNGKLISEGHYSKGMPVKWWSFYEENNSIEKCVYQTDGATRFCLVYSNNKLMKAKKYINDNFLQQWTSISSFKLDNPEFSF